jgi:hypothetical protein
LASYIVMVKHTDAHFHQIFWNVLEYTSTGSKARSPMRFSGLASYIVMVKHTDAHFHQIFWNVLEYTSTGSKVAALPNGERRGSQDSDEITFRGRCIGHGYATNGFGSCVGRIEAADISSIGKTR